ncbi:LD-carboxypeptidase [Paenibacillus sp. NPDC055715]
MFLNRIQSSRFAQRFCRSEGDYELIGADPNRLCGYSDITTLSHAIYAKTGLITYAGPRFLTFGMQQGNEYTTAYF